MIMFNIRKKIIERAINHTKREVVFPNLNTIKSVGFVLDGETDEKVVIWHNEGKLANVGFIKFVNQKRGTDNSQNIIYRSDLNFWKLPPDRLVHPFIETHYDLLINLAGINNDSVTYICAASRAKFKVCYKPLGKIYDMVIELDENNKTELVKQLKRSLIKLNSKE